MGDDEEELGNAYQATQRRIAFYGSTRTYKGVMDIHGWGEVCLASNRLAAAGRWDDMAAHVTNEMVETFATMGTYDQIVGKIKDRFGSYATQIGFNLPVEKAGDEERLRSKIAEIQQI